MLKSFVFIESGGLGFVYAETQRAGRVNVVLLVADNSCPSDAVGSINRSLPPSNAADSLAAARAESHHPPFFPGTFDLFALG
jgi:hypothetical protein